MSALSDDSHDPGWTEVPWPAEVRRPDDPREIVRWDAATLSMAIRTRVVSCTEVMAAYLDQIDRINPRVNAIVGLRPRDVLLAEAAQKDRLLEAGHYQGWMHGFPQAVKDLADVTGMPTSAGFVRPSWGWPDASRDSLFVARIRAAGAIFIGKTNTPELGLGSQTYNEVFGVTGNAWDPTRTAGGSSGGAAVAVALRMLPVADGSDFMGSLRNPPGWNNVLGLRPSWGRIPDGPGDLALDQGGVIGPIARTALDLALLLRTMSGHCAGSPPSLTDDPAELTGFGLRPDLRGRRVAWLGDLGGYLPMEDDVRRVTTTALAHFEELGMSVTALDGLPVTDGFAGNADLWPTWLTYRHWLAGMSIKTVYDLGLEHHLKPEAVYEYQGLAGGVDGGPISAIDIHRNAAKRGALYEAFRDLFTTVDYVVLPTAQVMPFDATVTWPRHVAGVEMSSYHRWMEVTTIGTLINSPTLALPAGFAHGLPIGLQVIGPHRGEVSVLELGQAWTARTGLTEQLPPMLVAS
ncbi:MAG: amidase [Nocardioides sp.]|uniref:amidase n=1 Tax=Nocardioides sp. TaxID=35761 RepID=UPI0039E50A5E